MHMQTHTHTYKLPCSWLKASQHIFLSIIWFFTCHHESICELLTLFHLFFLPYFCFWHTWNSNHSWNLQIRSRDAPAQLLFFPTTVRFIRLSAVSRQEGFGRLCCSSATEILQLGTELCAWGFSDFQWIFQLLHYNRLCLAHLESQNHPHSRGLRMQKPSSQSKINRTMGAVLGVFSDVRSLQCC